MTDMIFDVVVAGAGPAGTSVGHVLGRAGKRVLLLDKDDFPRDKTCGDGITSRCFDPLERLGLMERFRKKVAFHVDGYSLFFSDYSELTVRPPPSKPNTMYVLRRYDFDALLLDGALQYSTVHFEPNTLVRGLLLEGDRVTGVSLTRSDGSVAEVRASLVVDATGATTSLASKVGLGNRDPSVCAIAVRGYYSDMQGLGNTVEIYFDDTITPGYFWIFPTSPTSANIGCGALPGSFHRDGKDLREVLHDFLANHPRASQRAKGAKLCGSLKGGKIPLALEYQRSRVRDGFIAIGDAGAFVEPLTGEGISYAMRTGIVAGEIGLKALNADNTARSQLEQFDTEWHKLFDGQFQRGALLSTTLQRSAYSTLVMRTLDGNADIEAASQDLGKQYELLMKLLVLSRI